MRIQIAKAMLDIFLAWLFAYVVLSELAFVQYARDASLVDLLRAGVELAGLYASLLCSPGTLGGCDALGFKKRELVTPLARLSAYAEKASCEQGTKRARVTLRYLHEGGGG